MNRITDSDLNEMVRQLNVMTDNPVEYRSDGKTNVGNYHIDRAYGGVKLVRTTNEHGAIRDISCDGFGTKRQLYTFLRGMIAMNERGEK